MKIERVWAMPNCETFSIPPITDFINNWLPQGETIDPFARNSKLAKITNDLDPQTSAEYHLEAIDFIKKFGTESIDGALIDPPYTPRQISEVYKKLGKTVNMETTQMSYWGDINNELARVIRPGGRVLSFGWNSNGLGKNRGFDLTSILLVAHGSHHNDTICVAETKIQSRLIFRVGMEPQKVE